MGEIHFVGLPEDKFLEEALTIVGKANDMGIQLRIIGALAIYIHSDNCPSCREKFKTLGRFGEGQPLFTDLDLIGYGKQRKNIRKLFEETFKFKPDFYINRLFGTKRHIYYHPKGYYHVDVFFDKLEFSHDVNFKNRLELDYPTITLADLVLEKTQIHQINRKDIIDLIVLFLGHEIGDKQEKEVIDGKYIAKILADDWGFYYDATNNLKLVKNFSETFVKEGKLSDEEYRTTVERVDKLLEMIEAEPKSRKWCKRAKVGTKKPWYREVEEIVR
ncbi:MAG: hypothetical protein DRJ37_05815 [Thermoprotei archaeon]|nr:MAG: hypothetical protein DRJ37_05815 [Thermoprotei archaeon]